MKELLQDKIKKMLKHIDDRFDNFIVLVSIVLILIICLIIYLKTPSENSSSCYCPCECEQAKHNRSSIDYNENTKI